MSPKQSSWSVF